MKAFGYEKNGGPEVFQEYEVPTPEIKSNQILIKTEAFNLNNFEALQRAGQFKPVDHRIIPGRDVAGFVEKVGEDVTGFDIGDRVVAHGHHSYAEYSIGEDSNTVLIPSGVPYLAAAGIVTPGLAAYKGVHLFGKVQAGQTVVVKGLLAGLAHLPPKLPWMLVPKSSASVPAKMKNTSNHWALINTLLTTRKIQRRFWQTPLMS